MRRPMSLHLVKQDRWVANGRACQPRCRRGLNWAGLAVSWIFTVRSPDSKNTRVRVLLWSVEGCGS